MPIIFKSGLRKKMGCCSCNSVLTKSKNKKAFVLTLDALLAVIITLLILGIANGYVAKSADISPNLQILREGSDIITLLENTDVLQTLNQDVIKSNLNDILPEKYGMKINITWQDAVSQQESIIETGENVPEKNFVAAGKRFFVVITGNSVKDYCMAEYWIWIK